MRRRADLLVPAVALVATAAAVVFAALYFFDEPTERVVSKAPCGEQRIFGHIASLTRADGPFEMRFDPAWFLSGATANVAAAEDGAVEAGEPVPNDNYRVDETHRLYTYLVAPNASVTVLTRQGDPAGFGATPISVAQLASLVGGGKPVDLFEPLDTGVWLRVHVDTACAIDQQYQP
jgi:hypothetical protein